MAYLSFWFFAYVSTVTNDWCFHLGWSRYFDDDIYLTQPQASTLFDWSFMIPDDFGIALSADPHLTSYLMNHWTISAWISALQHLIWFYLCKYCCILSCAFDSWRTIGYRQWVTTAFWINFRAQFMSIVRCKIEGYSHVVIHVLIQEVAYFQIEILALRFAGVWFLVRQRYWVSIIFCYYWRQWYFSHLCYVSNQNHCQYWISYWSHFLPKDEKLCFSAGIADFINFFFEYLVCWLRSEHHFRDLRYFLFLD